MYYVRIRTVFETQIFMRGIRYCDLYREKVNPEEGNYVGRFFFVSWEEVLQIDIFRLINAVHPERGFCERKKTL